MITKKIDSVKKHIDLKIRENLVDGFDDARNFLFTQHLKFKRMANVEKMDLSDSEIESISDTRTRYLTKYVYHSQKRIKDLYKIEREYCKIDTDPQKMFMFLLFKERMEGKINYNLIKK